MQPKSPVWLRRWFLSRGETKRWLWTVCTESVRTQNSSTLTLTHKVMHTTRSVTCGPASLDSDEWYIAAQFKTLSRCTAAPSNLSPPTAHDCFLHWTKNIFQSIKLQAVAFFPIPSLVLTTSPFYLFPLFSGHVYLFPSSFPAHLFLPLFLTVFLKIWLGRNI